MRKLAFFLVALFALSVPSFAGTLQPNGIDQGDLYYFLRNVNFGMKNNSEYLGVAREAAAAASENVKTTVTGSYQISGVYYQLAPSSSIDLSGAGNISNIPVQSGVSTRHYLISVNPAGTGTYITYSTGDWQPNPIDGYAPIIDLEIGVEENGTFTLGTTKIGESPSVNYVVHEVGTLHDGGYGVQLTIPAGR